MKSAIYPMTAKAQAVADRWTQTALSCEPADHARAEAAARLAYQAAGQPEPSRFLWCPSPPAAVEQLRRLLEVGHTSLVTSVRRDTLNRSLAVARAHLGADQRARAVQRLRGLPPLYGVDRLLR